MLRARGTWRVRSNGGREAILPEGWEYVYAETFGMVIPIDGAVTPSVMADEYAVDAKTIIQLMVP